MSNKKRNEFIIKFSDSRDIYFKILFGSETNENNELYSKLYHEEFTEIIQKFLKNIQRYDKMLFGKDLCIILTTILFNENLTFLTEKQLNTAKFYLVYDFLRGLM